jgi:hypothetical protein
MANNKLHRTSLRDERPMKEIVYKFLDGAIKESRELAQDLKRIMVKYGMG